MKTKNRPWTGDEATFGTPVSLFRLLHRQYRFDLDACATAENTKCRRFISPAEDGLATEWSCRSAFVNPPYGKALAAWTARAVEQTAIGGPCGLAALLLPAYGSPAWWHENVLPYAELRFIRGRVHFGGRDRPAAFSSVLCVYRQGGFGCLGKSIRYTGGRDG